MDKAFQHPTHNSSYRDIICDDKWNLLIGLYENVVPGSILIGETRTLVHDIRVIRNMNLKKVFIECDSKPPDQYG